MDWFRELSPVLQAALGGGFTWGLTALGAGLVFFFTGINRRLLDAMLGFSGGVMLAASYWSLLAPAIEAASARDWPAWLVASSGVLMGAGALWAMDKILPHLHIGYPVSEAEGPRTDWQRSVLLVAAITMHNIPEGLAVGVAFGGVVVGDESAGLWGAMALAIGIGIQNFPEGVAVAMPLRGSGMKRLPAFAYGQASAVVEPIAAVIGAAAVVYAAPLLPFALAFAAGAMIWVVVEELVPESQRAGNGDLATLCLLVGFCVMMTLDVALG
ncbi:MAG: ZIP family metal transporter [Phycisphaeraceae bacterium]